MIRVEHLHFPLAKFFYDTFHRTNKPPVGHKQSFILIKDTGSYEPVSYYDYSDDELFGNWFQKAYPNNYEGDDFVWCGDENGDPTLYSLGKVLGILSIGNPVARFKDKNIFEITRVCFHPNFNPLKDGFDLPSHFVKEAIKEFGLYYEFKKIVTYIHKWQKGKYLEFAGFKKDKEISYSENSKGWSNRPNRSDSDLRPKVRYVYEK